MPIDKVTEKFAFQFECPHCSKSTDIELAAIDGRFHSLTATVAVAGSVQLSVGTTADAFPSAEDIERFDAHMGKGAAAFITGTQWTPEERERIAASALRAGRIVNTIPAIGGFDRGQGDFTGIGVNKGDGTFSVGTLPAGVEIDPAGAWIDRVVPAVTPEVRAILLRSLPGTVVGSVGTTDKD